MERVIRTDDGCDLFVRVEGTGPPHLLLIHGYPFDGTQWAPLLSSLSNRASLAAADLRGFGGSPLPAGSGMASVRRHADDQNTVLRALGWEKAWIVGLSMGGYVAFEFLRRHRGSVAGLILMDTSPAPDTEAGRKGRRKQRDAIRREGVEILPGLLLEKVLGPTTRSERPPVVEHVREMMLRASPAGAVGALQAMADRPDSRTDLPGIDIPVLIIVGEEDAITPVATAKGMRDAIPGADLVIIPGSGHVTSLEAPREVERAIHGFLQKKTGLL